jgi:hypothetical protein
MKIKQAQYGTKLILVQILLDYKEKIALRKILKSNLRKNQSQSIPTSSSNFSITSDQYERVSVNLEIIEESISNELESEIKTRKTRVYKYIGHLLKL